MPKIAIALLATAVLGIGGYGAYTALHTNTATTPTQTAPSRVQNESDSAATPATDSSDSNADDNLTVTIASPPAVVTAKRRATTTTVRVDSTSVTPTTSGSSSGNNDQQTPQPQGPMRAAFTAANAAASQMVGHTEPDVVRYGSTYYMYYRTDSDEIGLATSADGQNWAEQGTVLGKGIMGTSNVVLNSSAETGTSEPDNWFHSSNTAWSTTEHYDGAKSLRITTANASADWRASAAAVNAGTNYKLQAYVKGQVTADEYFITLRWFASPDGSNFISEVNLPVPSASYLSWTNLRVNATAPVGAASADIVIRSINGSGDVYFDAVGLQESAWDDTYVISPSAVKDGNTYYLFYEGNNGAGSQIGYATASSPLGPFTKAADPVLSPIGSGFESVTVGTPAVTKIDGTWYLFYHGYNGVNDQIGLTWSDDLMNWTRHPSNPVLAVSTGWQALKVSPSSVYVDAINGYTYIAYEAANSSNSWSIGMAYIKTANLKTSVLTPQSTIPLLTASASGWDNDYVQLPSLVQDSANNILMYYSGHNLQSDSFSLGQTQLATTFLQ